MATPSIIRQDFGKIDSPGSDKARNAAYPDNKKNRLEIFKI